MKYNLKIRDSFGKQLEVLQTVPEKGDTFPTIVLVPGFGMDLHEYGYFDEAADLLFKNGFQTFRFSFEGTGKSEGDFVNTTLDTQVQQLKDMLEYVHQDRFTKSNPVGIFAQSFGTVVATAALPIPKNKVKTIVYTSAPFDPYTSLAKWFKRQRGFNPDGISIIERTDKRKTRVGPKFWESLNQHTVIEEIKQLTQPILFIHGSKDKRIPLWQAEDYFAAVTAKKRLHVVENADHAFTGKYRLPVLQLVTDWFNEKLMD